MKAAVLTKYGPPDAVQVTDVEMPIPGENDLLVRAHATTLNRTDCSYRAGTPFVIRFVGRRPSVLGTEFAGVVDSVGSAVTSFRPGDSVFGYCEGTFGAHAEYMTISSHGSVATMPAGSTFTDAAPSMEGSHYALSAIRGADITAGYDVLVNGATGAIGSAAVQLLAAMDVKVTAVCGTEHVDAVRNLGAGRVVDYMTSDFTRDSQRYDAVLDLVGKSTFGHCRKLLKPRGVYISSELGPYGQNPILALITPLFRGRRLKFPLPRHSQDMVEQIKRLIEEGKFKPMVDRTYPLDEIVPAYRYVETGQKIGNVVIVVAPADSGT